MSQEHELATFLPQYAAGTLDERQRRAIERHLAACRACREELALWRAVGRTIVFQESALPAPSSAVLQGALARARTQRPNVLLRAWRLLRAQVPLVRREIWLTSAVVMGMGCFVTLAFGAGRQPGELLTVIAPLIAAAGVAMIYGPENDAALELALATPTAPQQVLLARLVLVYGYDLALALAASVSLLSVVPAALMGGMILNWLAPMTLLSALALVLSLCIEPSNATAVSMLLWMTRWLGRGIASSATPLKVAPALNWLAQASEWGWSSPAMQFGLAAILVALALRLAERREALLPRMG